MATPSSVEAYLAGLPDERRAWLERLRVTAQAAAPHATEAISYQMPALRLNGRFLVSYAAFKDHYSLFPASGAVVEEMGEEIAPYLAGRGTIQFPLDQPTPVALIRRIVQIRVREELAAHPTA